MKKIDLYIGSTPPSVNNGSAWLKPVDGGFALYILDNGWKPLVLTSTNDISSTVDTAVQGLIGSVQDKKTANTVNGAKAYAKDAIKTITGTSSDTSADLTLNGLKAYIDERIAGLG